MKLKKMLASAIGLALVATMVGGPANAAGFSASLDKALFLNANADTVTVTLNELPADLGVYVRLCAIPADQSQRPTKCDGQGKWVSNLVASTLIGAGDAKNPVKLDVKAQFGSGDGQVNCEVAACAIHLRRDHFGGSGDFSLDRYYPVSFAQPRVVISRSAGKANVVVHKGKTAKLKFVIGSKTYYKTLSADLQKFSFALVKGKTVNVTVSFGAKVLGNQKVKG